jgi:predicted nucleic acid-binding protein
LHPVLLFGEHFITLPLDSLFFEDALDLLQALTGTLIVPTAVHREVFGTRELPPWIEERAITQVFAQLAFSPRLGQGEREAIVLALEVGNCRLLLDDLAARRTAEALNISVVGTVGLLVLAKKRGLLPAIKPLLDLLTTFDFRISSRLYSRVLAEVGES